ncbi:integrin-linked protein kinase [Meleagris gallopavo]|uniref:integrin-linked protein kinase n=1 Tax=Meleagris gallopavo TaxID=9103 RepID=UPI000549CCA5|nr:integrin-linked protein kinase [Meleagris gallopavo]
MSQMVTSGLSGTRSKQCTLFRTLLAILQSPHPKSATTSEADLQGHRADTALGAAQHGPHRRPFRDDHGFSPLHWACREGRSNVVDMLIMRGARINVMNRGDDTPLHLAASHGHRDIVQKLVQFKADINAVNEHGNTPLHYACFWGHDTVAEDLVGNGALVSIANKYSETPIDKAKMPLREILKERAEKLGQNLTKIPYKDTFWKGTTRTRPRNGTLNKLAGIDFKQLSLSQKLNENQSGELWKGRWQGNDIVIKMLKIRDWTTRKSRDFNEEYPKLRIFSHPNVLPVLGACQSPPAPNPIVISHWMPYGSLYNVLHEGTNFVVDQMQAVKFAFDIARGMAFLHTLEPLIPRHHLNSRSIMIDEDMTARVSMADVKFSFQCPGRMYAPAWVAPEALQKKPEEINRRSADMWSFAVLLWELVTREVPFADLSNMEIGMKVALEGLRPTIPPGISPHICKLMKICMNEDPAKRPKFDMIVPILEKMQDK